MFQAFKIVGQEKKETKKLREGIKRRNKEGQISKLHLGEMKERTQ
jgi:hypothetical protein